MPEQPNYVYYVLKVTGEDHDLDFWGPYFNSEDAESKQNDLENAVVVWFKPQATEVNWVFGGTF